jgi:hypothetical protein
MALGDAYITESTLATYMGGGEAGDATLRTSACVSASKWVSQHCNRDFNQTTTSSDRDYTPASYWAVDVADFHTTTGLVVKTDTTGDGTFATTWAATDYVVEPNNGVESGIEGYPYRKIRAVGNYTFLCPVGRARVRVTAQWGWAAIPEPVVLATKMVAAYLFNLKDSPLGVASFGDAGIIRTRQGSEAAMLLEHYRRPDRSGVLVA